MAVLIDILPMVFSLIVGAWTELKKQTIANQQATVDALVKTLAARERTLQSARKYETPHTSKSRKFILQTVFSSLFLFPMLLTFINVITQAYGHPQVCFMVPRELESGSGLLSLLWEPGHKLEYIQLCGFVLMPIHIFMAQIIGGFYFGQAGAKMKLV